MGKGKKGPGAKKVQKFFCEIRGCVETCKPIKVYTSTGKSHGMFWVCQNDHHCRGRIMKETWVG